MPKLLEVMTQALTGFITQNLPVVDTAALIVDGYQARPNVHFELGWFYGHFGRDRVAILKKAETDVPSDLRGIVSIDFHNSVVECFLQIRDELQQLGIVAQEKTKKNRAVRLSCGK